MTRAIPDAAFELALLAHDIHNLVRDKGQARRRANDSKIDEDKVGRELIDAQRKAAAIIKGMDFGPGFEKFLKE